MPSSRCPSHNAAPAVCAGLLAALWLAACGAAPSAPPPTPTPLDRLYPLPRLNSPEYGLHVSLWWHVDNKTGWRDADLVREAGFGWIKQEFPWEDISNARGSYSWIRTDGVVQIAAERGLKLLARLDHAPAWARTAGGPGIPPFDTAAYAEFCGRVAQRYAGRVAAYEVWNEPNLVREWNDRPPDPAGYLALLRPCYLAIKQADPQAIVVSAGLATTGTDDTAVAMPDDKYFRLLYEAGAAPFFDALGVHAPGYYNPPERSPDDTQADPALQARWVTFRHVEDIRAIMLAYGDGDKQIAITEMGWTSDPRPDSPYAWHAVSEAEKADYLVRAYQYARANWQPWIGLMAAIYIADPAWTEADEQYWWAVTRPTPPGDPADPLPAYEALKAMDK